MAKYLIKRLLLLIPVLLGVSVIVFLILRVFAPDPAPAFCGKYATPAELKIWRESHGLEKPVYAQYFDFVKGAATGDFGRSYRTNEPVTQEISARFKATVELAIMAIIISSIFGVLIGAISAIKKNSIIDNLSMILALIGVSVPIFWLGLLVIQFFSGTLHWLPTNGRMDPILGISFNSITGFYLIDSLISGNFEAFFDIIQHMILPACVLGMYSMAIVARMTRSTMLDTLNQDYVRTARAKGLTEGKVVRKHALRNALIPVVTVIGLQFGSLLGGAVLTETVFSWPGLGQYVVHCAVDSDFPVVQAVVLLIAVIFVIMNLIVDVVHAFIDPRIKFSKKGD